MLPWPALPQPGFSALYRALEQSSRGNGGECLVAALRRVRTIEAHIRRPLRIAVMGEQNSGKSTLINMLLRASAVPTGALSGMRAHLLLRYGATPAVIAVGADGLRARLTSKALVKMAVPHPRPSGNRTPVIYNASDLKHARQQRDQPGLAPLTEDASAAPEANGKLIELLLPHAFLESAELLEARLYPQHSDTAVLRRVFRPLDLAIWCTLAPQAWKETERQSWQRFTAGRARSALLLVTYKDALANAKEEARLTSRLSREAGPLFSDIMLVSPRRAIEALSAQGEIADAGRWERSGAAMFEWVLQRALRDLHRRRLSRSAVLLRRLAARIAATVPQSLSGALAAPFAAAVAALETAIAASEQA
jgi:Dynamin family